MGSTILELLLLFGQGYISVSTVMEVNNMLCSEAVSNAVRQKGRQT